jgi:DNA-3-methyladenine glycosylase
VEPIEGIELMYNNRFGNISYDNSKLKNLTNGPAKFCQSFGINRSHNGVSLIGDEFFVCHAPAIQDLQIIISKRIGIRKSIDLQWRYYIKDNPFVSKK